MKVAPPPPNERTTGAGDPAADARERFDDSWSSQFDELSEYLGHYFAARSDLWKLRGSKLAWNAALGALAGVVGFSLIAVAIARLLAGVAGGLALLFGGRAWAADLVTGVAVLAAIGIGFTLVRARAARERRNRLFAKYERRHDLQTERFGHDMSDRAAG
jgi:hypothetical protein